MSPGCTVRERQDQIVITCKTTSSGHYLTRGASLCPLSKHQFLHPQRGGRATLHCPDPGFRALSLGRMPVALGNHESSAMAPAIPAGARPPAPPEPRRSSPLLGFISPRQHGPHRSFPHASSPSSPPQQRSPFRELLWLHALPLATHMRSELRARQSVPSAHA